MGNAVTGLRQHRNSCFIASGLQVLGKIPGFLLVLLGPLGGIKKGPVPAVVDVFQDMWQYGVPEADASREAVDLRRVRAALGWTSGSEEDAAEFLHSLLCRLQAHLTARGMAFTSNATGSYETESIARGALGDSPIVQLFGFVGRSCVTCSKCGCVHEQFEPQNMWTVDVPPGSASISLHELMTSERELCGNNRYECPTCKRKVDAVKTQAIVTPPGEVLLVRLNRLDKTGPRVRKITRNVVVVLL